MECKEYSIDVRKEKENIGTEGAWERGKEKEREGLGVACSKLMENKSDISWNCLRVHRNSWKTI